MLEFHQQCWSSPFVYVASKDAGLVISGPPNVSTSGMAVVTQQPAAETPAAMSNPPLFPPPVNMEPQTQQKVGATPSGCFVHQTQTQTQPQASGKFWNVESLTPNLGSLRDIPATLKPPFTGSDPILQYQKSLQVPECFSSPSPLIEEHGASFQQNSVEAFHDQQFSQFSAAPIEHLSTKKRAFGQLTNSPHLIPVSSVLTNLTNNFQVLLSLLAQTKVIDLRPRLPGSLLPLPAWQGAVTIDLDASLPQAFLSLAQSQILGCARNFLSKKCMYVLGPLWCLAINVSEQWI